MQSQQLTTDDLVAVLAAPQRRFALERLRRTGTASLDSLTAALADENTTVAPDGNRNATRTELHHTHLPLLDVAGLVDYDSRTGRVEPDAVSDERLASHLGIGTDGR